MKKFPSVEILAKATLDEIIKAWEGLGYYSQARCLWKAAKALMKNFKGQIPHSLKEWKEIKGVGPYTIGAIQS